jgi:8-oxo-dGTP pyrophosphatase MutT (NUDIX family)
VNEREPGKVERLVSAGGVVVDAPEGRARIVLCGRAHPRLWSLPKGTPTEGESLEETARREVEEETGLRVEIREKLGAINYWFVRSMDRVRCNKTVHFYLMRATGGDTDQHDEEFDEVRWFDSAEALRLMNYPNEARMAEMALARIEVG